MWAKRIDPRLALIDEDVGTLGGLAVVLAGEVPKVGRVLEHDSGWRLEVTAGDERQAHPAAAPCASARSGAEED